MAAARTRGAVAAGVADLTAGPAAVTGDDELGGAAGAARALRACRPRVGSLRSTRWTLMPGPMPLTPAIRVPSGQGSAARGSRRAASLPRSSGCGRLTPVVGGMIPVLIASTVLIRP